MRLHQDGQNSFYQDLAMRATNLITEFQTSTSFMTAELGNLTEEQLNDFLQNCSELKLYKRKLQEVIRQKKHILDAQTELLLAQLSEVTGAADDIFSMFNNADVKFDTIKDDSGNDLAVTHGTFINHMENPSRDIRESAFKSVYKSYEQFQNTIATIFSTNIKEYDLIAKLRHFESPIHSALSPNNIPVEVYNNLLDTVTSRLGFLHEYVTLRKNTLNLEELHIYDLYVSMLPDYEKTVSYDEACETIIEAMKPLGDDYIEALKLGFNSRWVDKYENEGKRSGAYSWGCYGSPHPFVLMNYTDNVNNMFTLAHEMGHALHSYYSHKTQPYPYARYCIFVAEVASTVNEALLINYLLKTTTDPDYKKYLINHFMEQFRNTLYRQVMFADFEKQVHTMNWEGTPLTAKLLYDTYYNLVKKYYGDDLTADREIGFEWARIPHFYKPFYVYQYATGFSAAIAISKRILSDDPQAITDYKTFLSGGSSKDPIELLKIAGVDMSSPTPIIEALDQFESLIK